MLLGGVRAIAAAQATATLISTLLIADPAEQLPTAPSGAARIESCKPNSNCVSSNYREPPNRYVSPFKIVNEPEVAFQRAVRDLKKGGEDGGDATITEIVPRDRYIHLTVPGTAPASVDDIELQFAEGVVNVRCEARVTLPPPPFCVKKNCINGNMDQRSRVERMGLRLGLPTSDAEAMQGAKWTPIFFNSDRVPGFDDDDMI